MMKLKNNIVGTFMILMSIFQISCDGSQSEALRFLKNMKAKDYFEEEFQVAFAKAIEKGNKQRMRELLQQGADVNMTGRLQISPLFWAMGKRSLESFEFLLENGANPNIEVNVPERSRSLSLIEVASIAENSEYLRLLLKYGANPNYRVGYGERTVIYEAVMNSRTDNVRLLIEAGADINYQDSTGSTPFMTAAGVKNFDIVYLFLKHGADVNIKNRWGNDLIWMIKEFGDKGIKKNSEQYAWYQKVVNELKQRELL